MTVIRCADAARQPSPASGLPDSSRLVRHWPEGLAVRQRREREIADLVSLLGHADFRRGGATLDLMSPEDVITFLGSLPPGSFEAVGFLDDAVVAYGGVYPLPGWQKHTGILTLCVHHAYQRRGIGTAVLACLISTARVMMGLSRLQLTVFVDNARAIALYRRFGFVVEGRITDFVERPNGFMDAYSMALISPRSPTMDRVDTDRIVNSAPE